MPTQPFFKICNRGRSPAKVLFWDRALLQTILPLGQKLPVTPEYGEQYVNVRSGTAEPVNAVWIAPDEQTFIGTYQAKQVLSMFPDEEKAVRESTSQLWQFGVVVYKGLFGDSMYESRYCYRLGNNSWHMVGPFGYNEYK